MNSYELTPINRKSFYGKAIVTIHHEENPIHILTSYNTQVASYQPSTGILQINGWYSKTTARHINAFLRYHNLPTMTKAEMENHASQQPEQPKDELADRYYKIIQDITT